MMALTIGGTAISPPSVPSASSSGTHDSNDGILMFFHLIARSLETRHALVDAVGRRRALDAKLNDPALAGHPKRATAARRLPQRMEQERQACIAVMQRNAALARQWDVLAASEKHRYGLTFLVGESDPQMPIIQALWCDDRGLALLAPFPERWTVPHGISHRVFEIDTDVREYTIQEVMRNEFAPF